MPLPSPPPSSPAFRVARPCAVATANVTGIPSGAAVRGRHRQRRRRSELPASGAGVRRRRRRSELPTSGAGVRQRRRRSELVARLVFNLQM
jgi:hypothetical protein